MSVDRRHFLLAGGAIAGGGVASAAHAAAAPPIAGNSRSVTEFGVEPNSKADQTQALQKAIDELSGAGHPVMLPAGFYHARKLELPLVCSIIGVPGHTSLHLDAADTGPPDDIGAFYLFGVTFPSRASKTSFVQLTISRAQVSIANCVFGGAAETAIKLGGCSGIIESVSVRGYSNSGIMAAFSTLTITGCTFGSCGTGVNVTSSEGAIVTQSRFDYCGTGIAADGIGIVNGNIVKDAKDFGLKLGRSDGSGRVVAQGNLLENCRVGIGVTASGDDIFASLNLIHGAKNGSIRAFDGDKLVGPDLARESAEVYLNLTVAGNVAR
jgi:Pectate lyase superfamily protein